MPAFLEAINAPDLGLLIAGEDFAAYQDMTEEYGQEVRYQGGFGVEGPLLRLVRKRDEDTLTFSAILTKQGVARGMNDEERMRGLRDFDVSIRRGDARRVWRMCNWTRISVNSTLEQVTLTADISVPGYTSPGVPQA